MFNRRWFFECFMVFTISVLCFVLLLAPGSRPRTVTVAQATSPQAAPPPALPAKDDKPAASAKPALPPCVPDPRAGVLACEFTHVQKLEVKVATQALTIAYMQYQGALNDLNGTLAKFRIENKWPETAQFDQQNLRLILPLPAPEKPPTKQPAEQPAKKP